MCAQEPQARRVSDDVSDLVRVADGLVRELDRVLADGQIDMVEVERLRVRLHIARPVIEHGDELVEAANEVATGLEEIKSVINGGPLEPLHGRTQAKIVSIAEARIRRDARQKRKAAAMAQIAAAEL